MDATARDEDQPDASLDPADVDNPDDDAQLAEVDASVSSARVDHIQRAFAFLAAERERSGIPLGTVSVARVCTALKLEPAEILILQKDLDNAGLCAENPDEVEDADDAEAIVNEVDEQGSLLSNLLGHGLLGAEGERELGRAIQLAKRFRSDIESGKVSSNDDARRILDRGDQAYRALVLGNVRLAMDIARRYVGRGLELDDLLQEGILGLMRAADAFDPNLGFRFTTYATWWVRQHAGRAVAQTGRAIRLPVHVVDKLSALRKVLRRLRAANPDKTVRPKDLAVELGWRDEDVGKLLVIDAEHFVPLQVDDDDGPSLLEQLASGAPSPEDVTLEIDLKAFVHRCVSQLPSREAEILRSRFGFGGVPARTLESIGRQFGLTRERIRQIEAKGLKKLRAPSSKIVEAGQGLLHD
jgi:RNA polymerase sigma factor (sigma-70 family)